MRDYKEIEREDVVNELKNCNQVIAVVISNKDRLIRGGDYIKSGVYALSNTMTIADLARYENEDNVAFYASRKENPVATSQQIGEL